LSQNTDRILSKFDITSSSALNNRKSWDIEIKKINEDRAQVNKGGGEKNIEKQHAKNRLTARERINLLIDKNSRFYELGQFVAFGMYEEWGGAPSAGTVAGLGYIEDRLCMIIANDATVKAGSFFPMTSKKVIRSQTIAYENHIPTIYLVDSAGIFFLCRKVYFPVRAASGEEFT